MTTIADWERDRFEREAAAEIDAAPITFELRPGEVFAVEDVPEVECLRSRLTGGLGVQLLWLGSPDLVAITVTLNGETETFEIHPRDANDAFEHPYAYGATLPL